MNVIFVNPPIRLPEVFAHYPMFSTLGMLSNAAWVRSKGHTVRVVDAFTLADRLNLRVEDKGIRHVGAEVHELAAEVHRVRSSLQGPVAIVVALTMFSEMNRLGENLVPQTLAAIGELDAGASIGMADLYVCGMNYFPFDPVRVLTSIAKADWLLVGEGEPTLPELLRRLESSESLEGLPRVARRADGGGIEYNSQAPEPIKELDTLPPPAFDLINMDRFFSTQADAIAADLVHEYHVPERQLALMTSRSCPFRCNFCTNQVLGLPWRAHSVGYMRALACELRQRYGVERFLFLDGIALVAREGISAADKLTEDQEDPKSGGNSFLNGLAGAVINWDHVLRTGNTWYDEIVAGYSKPSRSERKKAMSKVKEDIEKQANAASGWASTIMKALSDPKQLYTAEFAKIFVTKVLPTLQRVANAADRGSMQFELDKLAFALAAYRADHGSYPAKLADLKPKYVAEVPRDIFNEGELIYRPEGTGYLLYSVGVNGKDDGGKTRDDRKADEDWDDLVVRMTAPK